MMETTFDAKVSFVKRIEDSSPERVMIACQPLGVNFKPAADGRALRTHINVFFPATFRGVDDLDSGDIVRVTARVTTMQEVVMSNKSLHLRISMHGYSVSLPIGDKADQVLSYFD